MIFLLALVAFMGCANADLTCDEYWRLKDNSKCWARGLEGLLTGSRPGCLHGSTNYLSDSNPKSRNGCLAIAAKINSHVDYNGPTIGCDYLRTDSDDDYETWDYLYILYVKHDDDDSFYECGWAARNIQRIVECDTTCSTHGTCRDAVCICNPDLGGGWGGRGLRPVQRCVSPPRSTGRLRRHLACRLQGKF